jgi:hypothetical protein
MLFPFDKIFKSATTTTEGFTFLGSGFPRFEGFGGFEGGRDSPFYSSPLFPRPSVKDERLDDLQSMILSNTLIYQIGYITLITLFVGFLLLALYHHRIQT